MKKIINSLMLVALIATASCFVSCSDDDDDSSTSTSTNSGSTGTSDQTKTTILSNYVNNVVIPTYRSLADYSIDLADDCADLSSQEKVDQACADWFEARKYWELSEAFLFGAAADYNIDPHIDSWPLDLTQLDEVLKAGNIEERVDAGTAGYGLLGFHAVEYVLFREGSTGDASNRVRDYSTISEGEKTFARVVAEDMMIQCVRLEAAWAGMENVTAEKQSILEEEEMEPTLNYGEQMINAGLAGNVKYKTYGSAFEEIIVGASDIANEVGNTKISDPMNSHQWSDVESPHSWNSVTDFADNIRSVRNAYYNSLDGTRTTNSLSVYVASLDADIDATVQETIAAALEAINNMPKPFRNYIFADTADEYKELINAAVDACNDLVDALDAAQEIIYD